MAARSQPKDSVCKLFLDRIEREGRLDQWRATLAEVMAETGQKFGQAKWLAMKKMGYQGPDDERSLHELWLDLEEAKAAKSKGSANETFEDKVRRVLAEVLSAEKEIETAIELLTENGYVVTKAGEATSPSQ